MNPAGTRIYVMTDTTQKARRDKLVGIYAHAHAHGWTMRTLELSHSAAEIRHVFAECPPDGLILDGCLPPVRISSLLRRGIPIVAIDLPEGRLPHGVLIVHHDDTASARLAAHTLLELGCANFATLEMPIPQYWSPIRTKAFMSAVSESKHRCWFLRRQKSELFGEILRKWLLTLPKPCGIFASNDSLAKLVVDFCNELKLSVPGEITVIGIDNDEFICNTTTPTLTSVIPDFHSAGRFAAEMMEMRLHDPSSTPSARYYGPLGVARRESTRTLPTNRKKIGDMVEFIRNNARLGIHVGDVLALSKLPKSTTELHFRRVIGHSIAKEIQRVRLESVCSLLRNTYTPISDIATQCGYQNDNHLKNLFRKKFGMTMSAYRRRH